MISTLFVHTLMSHPFMVGLLFLAFGTTVGTFTYPATGARWPKDIIGHFAASFFDYTGSNSYTTGGDALSAGAIKLGAVEYVFPGWGIKSDGSDAVVFVWNKATGKIQAFWGNAGA